MTKKIGLGITTLDRPQYYTPMVYSIVDQLRYLVDYVVVVNDGTYKDIREDYAEADLILMSYFTGCVCYNEPGRWYCAAKNLCFKILLEEDCDYIFVADDDVLIRSTKAIDGYIEAMEEHGIGHMSFHAPLTSLMRGNGQLNAAPVEVNGSVTTWPNHSAQWLVYSREALETCGLFDPGFEGSWEHIEHTTRMGISGFGYNGCGAYDATGSEEWIEEIDTSPMFPVNQLNPDHDEEMKHYWYENHIETYRVVFNVT